MPVFEETSYAARDLRILASQAPPLPRLTSRPIGINKNEHEVVVIGVGLTVDATNSFLNID